MDKAMPVAKNARAPEGPIALTFSQPLAMSDDNGGSSFSLRLVACLELANNLVFAPHDQCFSSRIAEATVPKMLDRRPIIEPLSLR